jgi:hypothetical protein
VSLLGCSVHGQRILVSRQKLRGAKEGPKNGKDLPVNTNFGIPGFC